jgi:hypothetical protein
VKLKLDARPILTLWQREIVRFYRQRSRIV